MVAELKGVKCKYKYKVYKEQKTMDLFERWLRKEKKSRWVRRALTDPSYKNAVTKPLDDKDTNAELATLGDAVIKLCLSDLMLGKVPNITEEKKYFECDDYLARKVAKHYKLVDRIHFNRDDAQRPQDYGESLNGKLPERYKYIATAVEAMVGAIYKETGKLKPIIKLVDAWVRLK